MISPDVLLGILQNRGPSLPSHIKKEVGMDLLLTSAMLSNLVTQKKVKLTALKVGSSPLYYLPGQEEALVEFIDKLPEKEQRAVHLLEEQQVLRDAALDAVTRFCLRQTKDFAEQLTVTIGGEKEIFWKWYLLSDDETETKIRALLTPPEKPKLSVTVTDPPANAPESDKKDESVQQQIEKNTKRAESKSEDTIQQKAEGKAEEKETLKAAQKETKKEASKSTTPIQQDTEKTTKEESAPEKKSVTGTEEKAAKKEESGGVARAFKSIRQMISSEKEPMTSVLNEEYADDPFYASLMEFFNAKGIGVVTQDCVRKKSEYDFRLKIDSPVGIINYYAKAKSKKKLTEGDLSSIFLKAQSKNMPILLLTTGDLSKNAQALLDSDLQGLTVKKI